MPVNIAIVDDKASNRSIIKDKLLRHTIFEVSLTAENGKDFLDKMKILPLDKLPSVVLMDLEMPEMDGVDAVSYTHLDVYKRQPLPGSKKIILGTCMCKPLPGELKR